MKIRCKYWKICRHYSIDSMPCNEDAGMYTLTTQCFHYNKQRKRRKKLKWL